MNRADRLRRALAKRWVFLVPAFCFLVLLLSLPRLARAFGEDGAFNPRQLLTGRSTFEGVRATAPARWSRELVNRTSAPARLSPTPVRADDDGLWSEPFAYLSGDAPLAPFSDAEIAHLRR